MNKKVVIISSSFRKNGNSETLVKEFEKGANSNKNEVKTIYLRDVNMNFCKGCLTCQKTGKYVIKDDIETLINEVKDADVLCFATPIYYYSVSGQLKTFLDRMNPIFAIGHNFKDVYLLTSAADSNDLTMDIAIKDIQGWISCFEGTQLKGIVKGTCSTNVGDILEYKDKLSEAYNLGKNI